MNSELSQDGLPGFWRDADTASLNGQKWSLRYARSGLLGAVVAAFGGAIGWEVGRVDVAACVIVVGFGVALISEMLAWSHQPEQLWYEGRALAESAKTLSWRYAVGGEPFPLTLPPQQARALLRSRLSEVSDESKYEVTIASDYPVATDAMEQLRQQPFEMRRDAYLNGRTIDQQRWYATRATLNRKAATAWRIILVSTEIAAVVMASLRVFGGWKIDLAGVSAAIIASGAAWVAVKQYTPLAAAYSTAARELAIQADRLRYVAEKDWPSIVANAEDAISREHTLWVASRTRRPALT
jgi:hypothetical protein